MRAQIFVFFIGVTTFVTMRQPLTVGIAYVLPQTPKLLTR